MNVRDELKQLSEKIKTYRDEARLQLHLAGQDAKDEWDDLEKNWEKFRGRLDEVWHDAENTSKETSREVREKTHEMGEDLKDAYEKLRDRLK